MTQRKVLFYLVYKAAWDFAARSVVKETDKTFTTLYVHWNGAVSDTRINKPNQYARFDDETAAKDFAGTLNVIAGRFDGEIARLKNERDTELGAAFAEVNP